MMRKRLKTRVSIWLLTVKVKAESADEARAKARAIFFDQNINLIDNMFKIEIDEVSPGIYMCDVVNFYFVERLGFCDSIRNLIHIISAMLKMSATPRIIEANFV
ncbi:hypothetical protein [Dysgonomonas mossii]|uniref:hypothetical protein n=1 Tax=Dysgonomonas mossii TaxID=163665 RepID=UPI003995A81A